MLSSICLKAFSIDIMVMIIIIKISIVTIDDVPTPTQMIIIGPSAIFGREFRTTMYGSRIRLRVSFDQSKIAINVPPSVAIKKPIMASFRVVKI